MNCEQCQRLVLSEPDPNVVPPEAAQHLAGCAACRDVVRRVLRIERDAARVPIPPSQKKAVFLKGFLNPVKPIPLSPKLDRARGGWRAARRWAPVAIAAGILIAVGLWWGSGRNDVIPEPGLPGPGMPGPVAKKDGKIPKEDVIDKETVPAVSLAALVLECNLELAGTKDPVVRVEVLARLGNRLRGESHWLAKAAADKELASLSRLHARVMDEGLLPRAMALAPKDRRRTLGPISQELSQGHAHLKKLAPRLDAAVGRRLEEIAQTTELAALALQKLMEEGTP